MSRSPLKVCFCGFTDMFNLHDFIAKQLRVVYYYDANEICNLVGYIVV